MTYQTFKFLHILGVIVLLGNVTVTSVWKVFADRTNTTTTIAFAQRLVTVTDWTFTLGGIALIMIGGYGMCVVAKLPLTEPGWLFWSQLLFFASGLLWLFILLPIQVSQSRVAGSWSTSTPIPAAYKRLSARWLFWGIVATVPLVASTFIMVVRP